MEAEVTKKPLSVWAKLTDVTDPIFTTCDMLVP